MRVTRLLSNGAVEEGAGRETAEAPARCALSNPVTGDYRAEVEA